VSAVAAAVVAVVRYRARGFVAASFDKPLSDGTTRVFMYTTADNWYSHYEVWLAGAVLLSAASVSVALLARRV
jgi:hypothetical protein